MIVSDCYIYSDYDMQLALRVDAQPLLGVLRKYIRFESHWKLLWMV